MNKSREEEKKIRHAPPSQLPLATTFSEPGLRAIVSTASTCPSKAATNGLAKMRSIFAAFTALIRSRARANGCISGSRLRDVGVGSPGRLGRCAEASCCSTDIFYQKHIIKSFSPELRTSLSLQKDTHHVREDYMLNQSSPSLFSSSYVNIRSCFPSWNGWNERDIKFNFHFRSSSIFSKNYFSHVIHVQEEDPNYTCADQSLSQT